MSMSSSLHDEMTDRIGDYLNRCIENPEFQKEHLSGAGDTHLFEKRLSVYYGKRYALTFSSATTAIQALCLAYGLERKEILTSPFNWGGSVAPFLLHGNRLRFLPFDPVSLCLDADYIDLEISGKTKAVLSVDFLGCPADSKEIMKICRERGIVYISDSARSLGAWRDGKPAGYFADATILSFSAGKTVYGGEGGAVVTDDEELYEKLLHIAHHPARQKKVYGLSGYTEFSPLNGRMNPLAAIVLNATFDNSLEQLQARQHRLLQMAKRLSDKRLIEPPDTLSILETSAWFQPVFPIRKPYGIEDVQHYCHVVEPSIAASSVADLCAVPASRSFRREYKGRFSSSDLLMQQLRTFDSSRYVRLTLCDVM